MGAVRTVFWSRAHFSHRACWATSRIFSKRCQPCFQKQVKNTVRLAFLALSPGAPWKRYSSYSSCFDM